MAAGDFEAAWRISDAILAHRLPAERDDPSLPYHLRWVWDGSPLDGADVLVRCYHGLGDTIQFSRFLPVLARRARSLTLECQPALIPLLREGLPGAIGFVPFDVARPLPARADCLEIMELCHALRRRPDPAPFLSVAAASVVSETLQVGLCWRVNSDWRQQRSLPDPEAEALLHGLGSCRVRSLQLGATLPGLADDCPEAVLETAQLVASLDLVISVDTMVGHLAGALGTPLLLLLDAAPDWRWRGGGEGSLWYRRVRKFQQRAPGDWGGPVREALAHLTRARAVGTLRNGTGL